MSFCFTIQGFVKQKKIFMFDSISYNSIGKILCRAKTSLNIRDSNFKGEAQKSFFSICYARLTIYCKIIYCSCTYKVSTCSKLLCAQTHSSQCLFLDKTTNVILDSYTLLAFISLLHLNLPVATF